MLGACLGLFIVSFTYFNDWVIRQTLLIGNHLPASVFGVALVLLLLVNPVLRAGSRRWPLEPGELALIIAMGLSVCAWPGSNLMRVLPRIVALPAHQLEMSPSWQATNVMSYVPGGSPLLAEGYIKDFPAFVERLRVAEAEVAPVAHRLRQHLAPEYQYLFEIYAPGQPWAGEDRNRLIRGVNNVLADPAFDDAGSFAAVAADVVGDRQGGPERSERERQWRNRLALEAAMPELIASGPRGSGVLLMDGQRDEFVTGALVHGWEGDQRLGVLDLPWAQWWPTLRLWVGAALFFGIATLCMMLIVHPQWSHREMLAYPIVRFVEEMTAGTGRRWLPAVFVSRLFWIGLLGVLALHLVNGLHAWFPALPEIPRQLDFRPLQELFPNARRVSLSFLLFHPTIYMSVVGFAFLINSRVSLSLGVSLLLWVALGSWLLAMGASLDNDRHSITANGPALRFGAYVGMTLVIIYFGRWYYGRVLTSALGLRRFTDVPRYAVWAGRIMGACLAVVMYLLTAYGGMTFMMAGLLVVTVLMLLLVLARLNVESGMYYAQPDWYPGIILAGIFGVQGLGPEMLILLVLASLVLVPDPRDALSPYIANGLRLCEQLGRARTAALGALLAVPLVLGLGVALVVTLLFMYNLGFPAGDWWAPSLTQRTFDESATAVRELSARQELVEVTGLAGLDHLRHARPIGGVMGWMAVGCGLVVLCAVARLRLPWWPLHPVLFLVWGTGPGGHFAFSFLLAGIVKMSVVRLGGERAYQLVKPLMIGFIAADLLAVLGWSAMGTLYYWHTGVPPQRVNIMPG